MNHDAVRGRLSAYMDERLSARAHAQVEAHLEACGPCRDELHALDRTVHLLRGLEIEEPPVDLAAKVITRLEAGEGQPSWSLRRFASMSSAWTAPLVTALAGLALVLAVQTIEIEVGWPGAGAELELASLVPVDEPTTATPESAPTRSALPVASAVAVAPSSATAGASLRTRCLREPGSAACAAWHSWLLGLAVDEPRAFVLEVDAVPDSARSRWLVDLSRFAAHSGSAPRVAERLRGAPDPRAQRLAPHFERVSAR